MRLLFYMFAITFFVASCKKDVVDVVEEPVIETESVYPIEFLIPFWSRHTRYIDFEQDGVDDVEIDGTLLYYLMGDHTKFTALNGWETSYEVYADSIHDILGDSLVVQFRNKALPYHFGNVISSTDSCTHYPAYLTYRYKDIYSNDYLNPDMEVIGDTIYYGFRKADRMAWMKVYVEGITHMWVLDANYTIGSSIVAGQ